MTNCSSCAKPVATVHLQGDSWVCRHCYTPPELMDTCRMFERGHENPMDPKGTTAQIREIKSRRLDTKTGRMFHYTPPKSYFFGGIK